MKNIAMILRGTIASCSGRAYSNSVRPSAKYADGLTACEVHLDEANSMITDTPQPADLHFMHVMEFRSGIQEIELYDGPKLVMKFWPTSPPTAN